MKFGQLQVGERFCRHGILFRKTSPLLACPEDGGDQQMMPRSADVEPAAPESASAGPGQPDAATVRSALGQLASDIESTLVRETADLPSTTRETLHQSIRKLVEECRNRIGV